MRLLHSLGRFFRSRNLAIGLIAVLAAYSVLATFVPRRSAGEAALRAWQATHPIASRVTSLFGLHTAYSNPFFIVLCVMLAVATAMCSWERTTRAVKLGRFFRGLSESTQTRLSTSPDSRYPIDPDTDPEDALKAAAANLRRLGLRVRTESSSVVDTQGGVLGLWGSPIFHWGLVALMLVIAAGQLTRAEGFMALPLGERVADEHANYLQINEGPLFAERHTHIDFEAVRIDRHFTSDGVDYGTVPFVVARRADAEIASGSVHANQPLKTGSLIVHMADFGPAVTLAVVTPGGAEVARDTIELDRSASTSSGTTPGQVVLTDAAGSAAVTVRVQAVVFDASGAKPASGISRAIIETAPAGSSDFGPPTLVPVGETIGLSGNQRLLVVDVKDWVRVSIANDWSVPFIYSLLIIAILGLGVAVLVPTRRATVLLVQAEKGYSLHLGMWHARGDALFKRHVIQAVREAAGEGDAT